MRLSWVRPDLADRVRDLLRGALSSWEEVFDGDEVRAGDPPEGLELPASAWPALATHVARAERVKEAIGRSGPLAAVARFGTSPYAIERAALVAEAAPQTPEDEWDALAGILACPIDQWLMYGQFLSRLVELGTARDPAGTVAVYETFVRAAEATETDEPSWPERVRAARDGLASLYVRVRAFDAAEKLYRTRFAEEPQDTTIAIGAARAFLEAGETARAAAWLGLGAQRAEEIGRPELAATLRGKLSAVRARLN